MEHRSPRPSRGQHLPFGHLLVPLRDRQRLAKPRQLRHCRTYPPRPARAGHAPYARRTQRFRSRRRDRRNLSRQRPSRGRYSQGSRTRTAWAPHHRFAWATPGRPILVLPVGVRCFRGLPARPLFGRRVGLGATPGFPPEKRHGIELREPLYSRVRVAPSPACGRTYPCGKAAPDRTTHVPIIVEYHEDQRQEHRPHHHASDRARPSGDRLIPPRPNAYPDCKRSVVPVSDRSRPRRTFARTPGTRRPTQRRRLSWQRCYRGPQGRIARSTFAGRPDEGRLVVLLLAQVRVVPVKLLSG